MRALQIAEAVPLRHQKSPRGIWSEAAVEIPSEKGQLEVRAANACVQVYMMDKRYLDPRRPLGTPTKEDQAEMLVPYDVELPMAPQLFATHQQQVANLRGALLPK